MIETNTLIIGAGPAGLAMAGRLRHQGLPFEMIEKNQLPADSWRNHYERLHLHTVKEYSHLPHLPMPDSYPVFVPRAQLVDYFDQYVRHFDIQPRYGIAAQSIVKTAKGWQVNCQSGIQYLASSVIIATGINHLPFRPSFPGEDQFTGDISHSKSYRNPKPFLGKKVLVVGMGNTGAEIALDLSEQNIETYISVRSPVNIIPRSFLGNPVQKTAYKLARLPNWLSDWIGAQVPKIAFGDLSAYGLRRPSVAPAKQLRETGKTPVIDVGAVAQIKKEKIRVVTEIAHLEEREVHFKDGSTLTIDAIILATGYRHNLKSLIPESDTLFNRDGLPSTYAGSGYHEGLYFLGFDNYKSGGILGIIHSESGKIAAAIKAKKPS